MAKSKRGKIVLAYSGGLDTSVAIRWLNETYDLDVVCVCVQMGAATRDLEASRKKAIKIGAVESILIDGQQDFVDYFVWPSLQADALYEGQYPMATSLGRPLIAKYMVDVARKTNAVAVAHGATGKGNDQVRMEIGCRTLNPKLKIVAPLREWTMTRDQEIDYAAEHGIPVEATKKSPFSIDENIWGRSVECGMLEDPWNEMPKGPYTWTVEPDEAPAKPKYITITFEQGIPVALDGRKMGGIALIKTLNEIAGKHGVGRIDMMENRLVGIKSRETYEAPAAVVLHTAHRALQSLTMSKDQVRFKYYVATLYADLVYNGLWYTALHQDLMAYVRSSQRCVSGDVRMKLYKGSATKAGVKSDVSLYAKSLATYDIGDTFDHKAAEGFIKLYGLSAQTQALLQKDALGVRDIKTSVVPPTRKY
ncbi:MAG TPA: argininosuccinate synthase [Candidatus Brocadiia bacterium]|nr:argininosuccinate synthase [Candidatus Brocadiia bacterium]